MYIAWDSPIMLLQSGEIYIACDSLSYYAVTIGENHV